MSGPCACLGIISDEGLEAAQPCSRTRGKHLVAKDAPIFERRSWDNRGRDKPAQWHTAEPLPITHAKHRCRRLLAARRQNLSLPPSRQPAVPQRAADRLRKAPQRLPGLHYMRQSCDLILGSQQLSSNSSQFPSNLARVARRDRGAAHPCAHALPDIRPASERTCSSAVWPLRDARSFPALVSGLVEGCFKTSGVWLSTPPFIALARSLNAMEALASRSRSSRG